MGAPASERLGTIHLAKQTHTLARHLQYQPSCTQAGLEEGKGTKRKGLL